MLLISQWLDKRDATAVTASVTVRRPTITCCFAIAISLSPMDVLGIHHVNVNIHSLPEALEFYVEGLGFTSFERPGFKIDGAWLKMGPHELHLFVRPDAVIDRNQHFALAVTDINDCARHLEAKGLKYRLAPEMAGVNRQIFIHDPSGNRIELNEVKPNN